MYAIPTTVAEGGPTRPGPHRSPEGLARRREQPRIDQRQRHRELRARKYQQYRDAEREQYFRELSELRIAIARFHREIRAMSKKRFEQAIRERAARNELLVKMDPDRAFAEAEETLRSIRAGRGVPVRRNRPQPAPAEDQPVPEGQLAVRALELPPAAGPEQAVAA